MTLQERLFNDMKEALKARQAGKQRLSVIRLARASLKYRAIAKGADLTEQDVLDVLAREVRMRRDDILEYTRVNRMDVVAELEAEIAILERQIGSVMGALMPQVKGRADGRAVQEIVCSLLTPPKL